MSRIEFSEISSYLYSSYINPTTERGQFYFHRYIWEQLEAKGLTTYSEFKLKGHILLYKYAIECVYEEFIGLLKPHEASTLYNYFEVVTYEQFKKLCPANQNPIEIYLSQLKSGISDIIQTSLISLIPIFISTAESRNNIRRKMLYNINATTGDLISYDEAEKIANILFINLVQLYKDTLYSNLEQSAYTLFCALRLTLNKSEDFFDLRDVCVGDDGYQQMFYKPYTYEVYKSKIQATEVQDNKSKTIELYINSIPK
ncbi:hypothetical protein AN641_03400 [Candidatus Epulonipiscioides gigas]|nr:hypothetical protein AN641_03400 [Epulopiscium sp. SCG-C07WGA-EpuloA2]